MPDSDIPLPFAARTQRERVEPRLPLELEQTIFVLTAYVDPLSVPILMLVAWRVKDWVERLQYRVILFSGGLAGLDGERMYPHEDDDSFSRLLSLSPSLLRDSVRHLCLCQLPHHDVEALVTACPNVEDLWGGPERLDAIGALPLKRLHASLVPLFFPKPIEFQHPLFSRLTHLEIFDRQVSVELASWSGLAVLPHLTHLAFNDEDFLYIFPDILRLCPSLKVLALVLAYHGHPPRVSEELARDPRFVWMMCAQFIQDWHMGALSGADYWTRAEDFVARRRAGLLEYALEKDESGQLDIP
ncbi:hypothetical protein FB45DRAFT_51216 [Roridomyces roridus]|uniref:F-box domain-containing protein n=1 Tax=Roridomyces roridus TaxID=1738132 RepID=A0AAD7F8N3_9AGAR|nr:hypothetical protein FB45DRAFT_51216 [Roridomyces roridus]